MNIFIAIIIIELIWICLRTMLKTISALRQKKNLYNVPLHTKGQFVVIMISQKK